ncbi:MAG TPA: C39 family peptidase [bacterium]|nr:C39 family peptidase [bacterium]
MSMQMQIGRRNFLTAMSSAAAALSAHAWPLQAREIAAVLDPFPLHKQETPYTCGPASLRMALEFLGHPLPEKEIARAMGTLSLTGTSPFGMHLAANHYLKKLSTGLRARDKIGKAATNDVIFSSISRKLPVIFTWLTENAFKPGTAVGHYSVIIGFDEARREFTIANPFGTIHPLDFDRFRRLAAWDPLPEDMPSVKVKRGILKMPADLLVFDRRMR